MTITSIKESLNSLQVSWGPPDPPNGIIINYTVQWREYNVREYESAFTDELSYNIGNLNVEHLYCVKLQHSPRLTEENFLKSIVEILQLAVSYSAYYFSLYLFLKRHEQI